MNIVFAGTMISVMVLCVFGGVVLLGGVTPALLLPSFALAILLGLLWGVRCLVDKEVSWSRSPMHWPVTLFVGYAIARYFFSPLEYDARQDLFQIGICALIYFVCATDFHATRHRRFFLIAMMLVAVFESGYGMWQALQKTETVLGWTKPEIYVGRASGSLICPNNLAGFLELGLGLVVARAAIVRQESRSIERSVILKILTIYVAAMMIGGIVLTLSRAGWAATLAGLTIFVFLGDWRPRFSYPRAAIALTVIACMSVAMWKLESVRNHLVGSLTADQTGHGVSLKDTSLGGRTLMWRGTLQMIRQQPVFGTGGGSWQWLYQAVKDPTIQTHPEYAHNDFLNLTSDYGIVGLLLMVAIIVGFVRNQVALGKAILPPESQAFAIGAVASVCSILVHSGFDFNLHIPANSFLLAAILGLVAAIDGPGHSRSRILLPPLGRRGLGLAVLLLCALGAWRFGVTVASARYVRQGDEMRQDLEFDQALASYRDAMAVDPRFPEPYAKTGEIYMRQAYWRRATAGEAERTRLAKSAITALEKSLSLNPYQVDVWLNKAQAHSFAGQNDLALQSYQKAIAICPVQAHSYFMLGMFYRDQGDKQRAAEAFRKSDELTPSDAARLNSSELANPTAEPESAKPDVPAEPAQPVR